MNIVTSVFAVPVYGLVVHVSMYGVRVHSSALEHCRRKNLVNMFIRHIYIYIYIYIYTNYEQCYSLVISLYRVANVLIYLEWGFYISALKHCRKMNFSIQLHLTLINKTEEYCQAYTVKTREGFLRKSIVAVSFFSKISHIFSIK